jgi:alpha/beta superfamily hydrolase
VIESSELALSGPAGNLEAVLTGPAEPLFTAVVAHPHPLYGGTMDNAVVREAEGALLRAEAVVLRFNFRGVGGSEGHHDGGRGERFDLKTAAEELTSRFPQLDTFLAGYSFGAVAALSLVSTAELSSPAGVLLLAPPVANYRDESWELADTPTAVLYGELDELTPEPLLLAAARRWGSRVEPFRIDGCAHDLGCALDPMRLRTVLDTAIGRLRTA